MAAEFSWAPTLAGSWIHVLDSFGGLFDGFDGLGFMDHGGRLVEVMLVDDCVATEITGETLADPAAGDVCGWRHTWMFHVTAAGEISIVYQAGSPAP